MPAHQKQDGGPLKAKSPVKKSGTPGRRLPRNLIVLGLALVAVVVGMLVVINRHFGQSGSATAKVGTGPNKTLADYFAANDITQTPVRAGETGAPVISIPLPQDWSDAGPDMRPGVYVEWLYDNAYNPDDVPFIDILLSRLDGAADPAKVLDYATGELQNLPGYRSVSEPARSQLSGFEAVQLGGTYTKNGEERIIAQKTVVISSENGMFVLQMNAEAPSEEASVVQLATAEIDARANITP